MKGLEIIGGYAIIRKDAKSCISSLPVSAFTKGHVKVMEFASDGGALCFSNDGTALGMFDKEDIIRSFKCKEQGDVLCPLDMDLIEQLIYAAQVMNRKGGYNYIVKEMVIASSLHRQEFTDSVLWAVERAERATQQRKDDLIKDIRNRMAKGEPTTFAERNVINIIDKKSKV